MGVIKDFFRNHSNKVIEKIKEKEYQDFLNKINSGDYLIYFHNMEKRGLFKWEEVNEVNTDKHNFSYDYRLIHKKHKPFVDWYLTNDKLGGKRLKQESENATYVSICVREFFMYYDENAKYTKLNK